MSDFSKRIMSILCALLLLLVLVSIAYYRSLAFLPFAAGVLLGGAINALKVFLLDRSIKKSIDMEKEKAGKYIVFQYLLRFLLTGLVLVLSAVLSFISIWGAAAGVLTLQIAVYIMKYTLRHEELKTKNAGAPEAGGD